jgi:hypothetical protein
VSKESAIRPHFFENGYLKLRKIAIGKNCFIGPSSTVLAGVTMEDNCVLDSLSQVAHEMLPRGTVWKGLPATQVLVPAGHAAPFVSKPFLFGVAQLLGCLLVLVIYTVPAFAGKMINDHALKLLRLILETEKFYSFFYYALGFVPAVMLLLLLLVALKWILIPNTAAGTYPLYGFYHYRYVCILWMFLTKQQRTQKMAPGSDQ